MCGIFAILKQHDAQSRLLQHRGPDQHVEESFDSWNFIFDRLAINGIEDGQQPFKNDTSIFMCNGEIYNHHELCSKHHINPSTKSDCEVVYRALCSVDDTSSFCASIDGEFAFVFKDESRLIVARDRYGVRPLFYALVNDSGGRQVAGFASEAKQLAMIPNVHSIEQFPPGEVWINFERVQFFKLVPSVRSDVSSFADHVETVRTLLIQAVHKRLMSERPVGYFLSGGLDSSIIAAIGATLTKTPITTYSIGMKNSDSRDLIAARRVAEHLHSNHIEIQFDAEEAIDAIPEVIRTLESYDCTTIRASVPMYLLCKEIARRNQSKVMLSGEGADELFGGYLYLHGAPSLDAFQTETISLLRHIHEFDGLRADRCTAAHGLELRVPFLDPTLVNYVVHMDPVHKAPNLEGRIEKFILRKAFESFLPKDIVYRQKNGMSDAVGSQWIDAIRKHVRDNVGDCDVSALPPRNMLINPPKSNEEMWYRQQFQAIYPVVTSHQTIWRPKWTSQTDPSARNLPSFEGH